MRDDFCVFNPFVERLLLLLLTESSTFFIQTLSYKMLLQRLNTSISFFSSSKYMLIPSRWQWCALQHLWTSLLSPIQRASPDSCESVVDVDANSKYCFLPIPFDKSVSDK